MSLTPSGMHAVIELAAGVVTRRVEVQAKRNAALACIDNPIIKSIGVMGVRLDTSVGNSFLVIEAVTQIGTELGIVLTLAARSAGDESMRVVFEATYHKTVDGWDPDGPTMTSVDEAFREALENDGGLVMGAFDVVDLEPLLPKGYVIEGDVELVLRGDDYGAALALGVEVAHADAVDRDEFLDADWPSIRSGDDFALAVDGALVAKRIREDLGRRRLGALWVRTGLVRTWWHGDEVAPGSAWGREAMALEALEDNAFVALVHGDWSLDEEWEPDDDEEPATIPIWVLVAGSFDVGEDDVLIEIDVLDAGWSYAPLPLPEDPPAETLTERELGDGLAIDVIGHAPGRLALRGTDSLDASGQPALWLPEVFRVKDSLQRCFRPIDRGMMLEKTLGLRNTGGAPLFVCGIEQQSWAPQLSVPGLNDLELPALIEAGEAIWLPVRLEASAFDTTYTGELVVRSNHLESVERVVTVEAEKRDPEQVGIALELCVEPPKVIPPQEWFENLVGLLGKLDELVSPPPGRDDFLEVRVQGLRPEESLVAVGTGVEVPAERAGGVHHLALPLDGERPGRIRVGARGWHGEPHVGVSLSRFDEVGAVKTRERVTALAAAGPALYLAEGDGVAVVDVTRAERPKLRTRLDVGAPAGLATDGKTLWVGSRGGTVAFDVRHPLEPKKLGRARVPRTGLGSTAGVRLRDGGLALAVERGRRFGVRLGVLKPRDQKLQRDEVLEILAGRQRR